MAFRQGIVRALCEVSVMTIRNAIRASLADNRPNVAAAIRLFEAWAGESACNAERQCLAANIGFGMTPERAAMRRWQYRLSLRLCPNRSIWRKGNGNPATMIGL